MPTDTSADCLLWSVLVLESFPSWSLALLELEISNMLASFLFFKEKNKSGPGASLMEATKSKTSTGDVADAACVMQISQPAMIFTIPKAIVNLWTEMIRLLLHVCKVTAAPVLWSKRTSTPISWEALGCWYSPHCYVILLDSFHRPLASHFNVDLWSFFKSFSAPTI